MNEKQIAEVKKQLWDYLEYLNVRWEEWKHLIGYASNGLREMYRLCEVEIEFWKMVIPDE